MNSVPFESWMEIDMRSQGVETLEAVDAILQGAIWDAAIPSFPKRQQE